ncbi:phosphotransferase family protein [Nocardioides mesophilus]|uniref:Phosphotransferase family protein n=1 Tax=Nocardioides mesophilus TaxID=433659 RepID=A0A7G9RFG9_9ACTN|nr:phosphotransferase family protein [Nocardioides mesophilus]QNN54344.1 phosphotransferase family protein [Nocardioides mesophilus]
MGAPVDAGNPPGPVRAEDAFDVRRVAAWLTGHAGVEAGRPDVRQYPGGASNLTFLLRYPDRDLILRRPPRGAKAKSAHDMRREFTIQQRLAPVFPYVAPMVAFCDDESVIGSEFYVMERLDGVILRGDLPAGLSLDADGAADLCGRFLDVLVELHGVDVTAAGLQDLGKGTGYVARQVAGWSDRYRRARTDNVGDFETVMAWLAERQPDDVATCVIHNDYRLDNVVLDPGSLQVRGVLDWEMATLGDPLMDLGGALAYWIEEGDDPVFRQLRRQPSDLPGMLTRWEMVQAYTARTGLSVTREQWLFYEVFGLFRLAVIAQQIYYRYHHGQTTNEAYAAFLPMVQYLEQRCARLIAAPGAGAVPDAPGAGAVPDAPGAGA